ncbi:MAG: formylglycine-generating enzyme family protein, partial [Planctomycetota bacterium]
MKPEAPASPQDDSLGSKSATPITFYYTFVVFPAGEYTIGSPDDLKRSNGGVLHRGRLTRPFAILNREVTFAELIAFNPERYNNLMKQMPLLGVPQSTGAAVSWYDAVRFSRWLSVQYGLSESEQAYADPASPMSGARDPNRAAEGAPQNWPLDVSRRGFRLPSEAEWEISSRGGVRCSYSFGSDESLLNGYGWFQENSGGRVHLPM